MRCAHETSNIIANVAALWRVKWIFSVLAAALRRWRVCNLYHEKYPLLNLSRETHILRKPMDNHSKPDVLQAQVREECVCKPAGVRYDNVMTLVDVNHINVGHIDVRFNTGHHMKTQQEPTEAD